MKSLIEVENASGETFARVEQTRKKLHATGFALLRDFPDPALELAWRDLLSSLKTPSHYTAPEFFREPYLEGKRPFAILVLDGTSVIGVLTGLHAGDAVTCGLPTRPQVQIHPGADTPSVIAAMVEGLAEEAHGAELVSIYTWEWLSLDPILQHGYRRRELEAIPVLDLKLGPEKLLKNCGSKRVKIRSAIKQGVEVFPAETAEHFKAFYEIYSEWCKSKDTECFPYELEERAFRTTSDNRKLFLARHAGRIIAGNVFRFFPGGLVEASRNSSLKEYQNLRPNELMMWRGIEWACENGFSLFSMNASHRFLREFGGTLVPVFRYRLDRTFLRRHDRREELLDGGRRAVAKLPPSWEKRVRRALGKERPGGW